MKRPKKLKGQDVNETGKRLKTTHLFVGIIVGIVLAVSAIVGILWQFKIIDIHGPKISVVVDCGSWKAPCCIADEFEKPSTHNQSMSSKDPRNLLKAQSMYHILVRNKEGPQAIQTEVTIPDAIYIEVEKEGVITPHWKLPDAESLWYPLGDIAGGHEAVVTGWASDPPERYNAECIQLSHKDAGPIFAYVKTPAKPLAEWVNQHTFWVLLAATVLVLALVVIYKFKLCRYLCNLASKQR